MCLVRPYVSLQTNFACSFWPVCGKVFIYNMHIISVKHFQKLSVFTIYDMDLDLVTLNKPARGQVMVLQEVLQ